MKYIFKLNSEELFTAINTNFNLFIIKNIPKKLLQLYVHYNRIINVKLI